MWRANIHCEITANLQIHLHFIGFSDIQTFRDQVISARVSWQSSEHSNQNSGETVALLMCMSAHRSCLLGRGARCGLTTWNWQAAGGGAQPIFSGRPARLTWGWRWGGYTQIPDLVKTIPETVPPAIGGAVGLLGCKCVWVAEARLQAAAKQQISNSLPHLTAAQSVNDGVQARIENSQGDEIISAIQQRTLAGDAEKIHQ